VTTTIDTEPQTKRRVIQGHAVTWDALSSDLGGFVEKFQRGAFTDTLASRRDIVLLAQHGGLPLASTVAGTLQLREDATGLAFRATLPETSTGRDVAKLLDRGDLRHMSFSFRALDDVWAEHFGVVVRTVRAANLHEISIVCGPAYETSHVGLRTPDNYEHRHTYRQ
jgi:uncharacterized protein